MINFSAGPAILSQEVFEECAEAVKNFNGIGLSILEISHRSKEFIHVMDEAVDLTKKLLHLTDDYEVIFISGGASSQFSLVPMNLLNPEDTAAYYDTGTWASKAIKEAKLFGKIVVLASSKEARYTYIPQPVSTDQDYIYTHITSNNTIYGTQINDFTAYGKRLVCDMSSDIFSRLFPIDQFSIIYAGAQKNLGPAGTTMVIIRKDALRDDLIRPIPSMFNYKNHIDNGSMYNTPPVFPIYVSMLNMRWIMKNGGVEGMHDTNTAKATMLYNEIDRNPLFYCPVKHEDRSKMNVTFLTNDTGHEALFLEMTKAASCSGLAGHRSVGGFRASIYNAMPLSGVATLVELMQEFERKYG